MHSLLDNAIIKYHISYAYLYVFKFKAAKSVTFDLLILELMFLFFKNTVNKAKIQVYIYQFRKS